MAELPVGYSDIASIAGTAERRFTRLRSQIEQYEQAYALQYTGGTLADDETVIAGMRIPNGTPVHIPSTGPATVDRFVEQVRTDKPLVTIGTIRKGRNVDERRRKLAAFGNYMMERIADTEDRDVWTDTVFGLTLRGAACIRVLYDPDEWPEDEQERAYAWPFLVRSVHPSNIYVPAGMRWPYRWLIEEQRRYYGDLRDEYPSWAPNERDDRRPWSETDECEVMVYWSPDEYILCAGGTEVTRKSNPLGIVPYVFDFSGFGHTDLDNDPGSEALGLLHHSLSELQAEVRLRTMSDALWQQSVWPTLVGTMSEEEFRAKWSAGTGRYISVSDMTKEKPEWLEPVPVATGMLALIPQLRDSIERSTYAEALTGANEPNVRSATQAGIQVGQARARVDKVRAATERMAGRVLAILARYAELVLGEPYQFGKESIKPEDIGGFDRFRVEFQAIDPAEDQARIANGLSMYQSNLIGPIQFLRDYKRDAAPEDAFVNMIAERMVMRLADQGMVDAAIFETMGLADRIQAAQQAVPQKGMQRGASVPNTTGGLDALEQGAPFGDRRAQGMTPGGAGAAQFSAAQGM